MINATEVNEENALFHSVRVNGGQAITHGKDLSSCTQAGNAASQTLSQSRKTETEKAIGQRELSLQSEEGAAALRREEQNCRARMEEGKEFRLEKRLSLFLCRLRPEAPEVSTALKARIIAVAE